MDNVVCSCLKCGTELGSFRNSWVGIGNTYFSPVYPPITYINGFETTGDVFKRGPDGSAVQNSTLQDLACRKCATVVGLRCDDAPAGHLLKKNQLILRLAEMQVISEQTGNEAIISVQQKIPLVAPSTRKLPPVQRAATVQPVPRHLTPNILIPDGEPRPINGTMLPPAQDMRGKDVAKFKTWAEDVLKSQQKDIDRINGAVSRIEKDMKSFKDFMGEVRAELSANRATRKTQQDLNQEQIAWLQEDLKEFRQENGVFQQDLREEELPDIRNQLDQLRQEIDSQEQATRFPNNVSLPVSVDEFKGDVLEIRRKFSEFDELKMELQRLQNRLTHMEGKRQESFVFPRTLIRHPHTPSWSSQEHTRTGSMPTISKQKPRLMLQAPESISSQFITARDPSPSRNPPGAFPDSIIGLDASPQKTSQIARRRTLPVEAQPQRPAIGAEIAETASPRPMLSQKWSYTGLWQWQNVKATFEAFGLEYPKLGIPESVRILENHVNNLSPQNSAPILKCGKVISLGHGSDDIAYGDYDELGEPEPSLTKRKHDQVEGKPEQAHSETMRKKRRRSGRTAELEQSAMPNQVLRSPTIRSGTQERRGAIIMSSDHGSPELGRDSRFRSQPDRHNFINDDTTEQGPEPGLNIPPVSQIQRSKCRSRKASQPDSTPASKTLNYDAKTPFACGSCGKRYKNANGLEYHKEHSACDAHEDDVNPKEFPCPTCKKQFICLEGLKYHVLHSPACRDAEDEQSKRVVAAWEEQRKKSMERIQRLASERLSKDGNAVLPSIEADDAAIPGAFPDDSIDAAAPDIESADVEPGVETLDMQIDSSKQFKCGSCGKQYKSPAGLKYHKEHSSCDDDPKDVIPKKFHCPSCSTELTYEGLAWHLARSISCRGAKGRREKKGQVSVAVVDEEQKRKDVLVARERLVAETLDREM